MDYRAFKAMIERQAHVPPDVADRALRTTLATLARRLTKGERRDLADQLPLEIAPWILAAEGEAAAAGVDAFLQDLAGRAGVDVPTAELPPVPPPPPPPSAAKAPPGDDAK